ncbi:MAG TPA: hypothetical protein VD863_20800, partial [Bradyrhizobium sp.]|nr:hypothetical protein [Bradyrhizobium sp.]
TDDQGSSGMDTEAIAKILGGTIVVVALVAAVWFGPIGQGGKPAPAAQKIEAPKAAAPAAPAVRGPVVREVPQ